MVDQSRIDQFKQTSGFVSRYLLERSRAIGKTVDPTTTITPAAMTRHVDKPWGYKLVWSETPFYTSKKVHVNAGKRLSLQYHNTKRESVFVPAPSMPTFVSILQTPWTLHVEGIRRLQRSTRQQSTASSTEVPRQPRPDVATKGITR
jgi:hypothetical protein